MAERNIVRGRTLFAQARTLGFTVADVLRATGGFPQLGDHIRVDQVHHEKSAEKYRSSPMRGGSNSSPPPPAWREDLPCSAAWP